MGCRWRHGANELVKQKNTHLKSVRVGHRSRGSTSSASASQNIYGHQNIHPNSMLHKSCNLEPQTLACDVGMVVPFMAAALLAFALAWQ